MRLTRGVLPALSGLDLYIHISTCIYIDSTFGSTQSIQVATDRKYFRIVWLSPRDPETQCARKRKKAHHDFKAAHGVTLTRCDIAPTAVPPQGHECFASGIAVSFCTSCCHSLITLLIKAHCCSRHKLLGLPRCPILLCH